MLNTKIINSFSWSNIDSASKYLGTYESHIQEKIIKLAKKFKLKFFIDLGAAEGYHLISLVKKNFFLKGFAFEINKQSRVLLKKNALVIGGAGFVGSNLIEFFLEKTNYKIINMLIRYLCLIICFNFG